MVAVEKSVTPSSHLQSAPPSVPSSSSITTKDPSRNAGMKSFLAGISAGMASTIAGYAPDTVKVRLQTQPTKIPPTYTGAVDCAVKMVREEGFLSLFKGMSTPLASRAIVNGMCFSSYTLFMGLLAPVGQKFNEVPLYFAFLAGGGAGAFSALVAGPTELIKVQMQVKGSTGSTIYQIRHLLKYAGTRGLLSGMTPTIIRDVICMGTFFTTTTLISQVFHKFYPGSSLTGVSSLLGGAAAGLAGWALCYPFDVWKSNVQDYQHAQNHRSASRSFLQFFRERYARLGLRGFYTGLAATLFRAVPVNATKFFAFDLALKMLHLVD